MIRVLETWKSNFTFTLSYGKIKSVKVNVMGECMEKFEILDAMVERGNGYLLTSDVVKEGISKPTLASYVRSKPMERVGRGIYFSDDEWPDELYLLYLQNCRVCFSHETALYLHGLMEREPSRITVTVKAGYNASHLRKRKIHVYQVKEEIYNLGVSDTQTTYGNHVAVYDRERTICDLIKNKENTDIQVFRNAMKEYMSSGGKNLLNLMNYASKLHAEDEVRKYTEVML